MPKVYRLFFLDAFGKMSGTDKIIADNDNAAITAARFRVKSRDGCHGFDLWAADRLIHTEKI